jgi:flagellar FliL protein
MRIILIAIVGLLVLGGAGAGAYFYFKHPAEAAVGDTEEHQAAKEAKAEKGEHGEAKFQYVELDPLILPIVDARGVSQTVSMIVVLQVPDADAAAEVNQMAPRLKDAYIQDMYGVLNKHAALQGGVVQVGMIKSRLNEISQRVMGEGVVDDVLLQVVQQRPM